MIGTMYCWKVENLSTQIKMLTFVFGGQTKLSDCKLDGDSLKRAMFGKDTDKVATLQTHSSETIFTQLD
ncbi:MAG: hypothetical protein R3Y18_00045 [Bacillota bacterium]